MAVGRAKSRAKKRQSNKLHSASTPARLPFIEHVYELRKRLFYVAVSVALFSGLAYAVEHHVVAALLRPAHGQKFIYTSPGGGIDFLFRVCLYVGIAASIPVIVYQSLRYVEPLLKKHSMRFIFMGSAMSGVLAAAGVIFGYFVGLPAALHFLLHQFVTNQIQPLLTIQSYLSFVTMYMLGAALLFQLPLILIFINRIKPLSPRHMLKSERWIILLAFVLGGIMNPSPNLVDQLMLAGPMIAMYQVGIGIVCLINRGKRRPKHVAQLLEQDAQTQAGRLAQRQTAKPLASQPLPAPAVRVSHHPMPVAAARVARTAPSVQVTPSRPAAASRPARPVQRRYITDIAVRRPAFRGPQGMPRAENA